MITKYSNKKKEKETRRLNADKTKRPSTFFFFSHVILSNVGMWLETRSKYFHTGVKRENSYSFPILRNPILPACKSCAVVFPSIFLNCTCNSSASLLARCFNINSCNLLDMHENSEKSIV